jgi:hypothetical protein
MHSSASTIKIPAFVMVPLYHYDSNGEGMKERNKEVEEE